MTGDLSCYNIADLRERARRRLPRGIWEYAERGTEDETGMARNRAAFERITFRPRVLRGVHAVDTGTTIFGKPIPFPLALGVFPDPARQPPPRPLAQVGDVVAGEVAAHPRPRNGRSIWTTMPS